MKRILFILILIFYIVLAKAQNLENYNIQFSSLPQKWDAALPLGNGMLGALIWQKGDHLRFSLDRADLWDERVAMDISKFNFKWVEQQVLKNDYDTVQKLGDKPYDAIAYPTKIPAAALEFNIAYLGHVKIASVDIATATAKVVWENGATLETFIHATQPFGVFRFTHVHADMLPELIMPAYGNRKKSNSGNTVGGQDLANLNYTQGSLKKDGRHIVYLQQGSNGFRYEVSVWWQYNNDTLQGVWSIASYKKDDQKHDIAQQICKRNLTQGYEHLSFSHLQWWKNYWQQSSVLLPDTLLQKQYYLEMYKFGSVAREGVPPITLQAIWTADNGLLPPWKGDIHHDLNTELSYWPGYTSNHLQQAASFTEWLWKGNDENKKYTKQYFQTNGMNVPGVQSLSGKPMGGWIQYSLSPTVSAWLSQYFYWGWKYSMDKNFLKERAYPYLHDVATYLSEITSLKDGKRMLPLSSTPEYHDNSIAAWYTRGNTNYDLALMKFAFNAASETAAALGKENESDLWKKNASELPSFAVDSTGLMIAPGEDRAGSHRHHSNLMAIYPLGLLNPEHADEKNIIDSSMNWLKHTGTSVWCGYSFSWAACLYARAKQGNDAAEALRIFASNFCSPNSFHLNGDQKGGQYSSFTYDPFTLEGNFAFAQGVLEMLLQSYSGIIEVFPAVPAKWKNIAFDHLLAEGAFVVSAKKENGIITKIEIKAEQDGMAHLKLPFNNYHITKEDGIVSTTVKDEIINIVFKKGGAIILSNNKKKAAGK